MESHKEQSGNRIATVRPSICRGSSGVHISNPTAVKVSDKEDDEIILRRPATLVRLNVLPRMVI